jgi:hypothetical protein
LEPAIHIIIFESEIASQAGAVDDANQLNKKGQMNFAVDCGVNGTSPRPAEPLRVSIEANVTEDGPPPTTIEFRAELQPPIFQRTVGQVMSTTNMGYTYL